MHPLFEQISFADPEQAARDIEVVLECPRPGLAEHLAEALRETPDPGRTLLCLNRYLSMCVSAAAETGRMASAPRYVRLLATIFSQSHFLTDIVLRHPNYVTWLWQEAELARVHTRQEMLDEFLGPQRGFDSFEGCSTALRRVCQREFLRIAVRDIFEHAPLASVTEDLSNLADATLEAALMAAGTTLQERFGVPQHTGANGSAETTGLVILALGKLGGRELNFSSDIDLLFVYTEEGETTGGSSSPVTNAEYFKKTGELIVKALSEQTADGFAFRVDMRLRPFGHAGPLAIAFEPAVDYYAEYGRAWECQALIKARPCAGDLALGEAFIQRLRPLVFPKYFDDATLEDIRQTKAQTEAMIIQKGAAEREVKMGRGGIRDIEFTVQMLQLLNGGRWPKLRTTNTAQAIDALGRYGVLSPFEATALASNYAFLRQLEHRLQIEGGRQCHELPATPEALDNLGRRLGYENGEALRNVYRDRTQENRAILERFLAAKGSGHLWVEDLLNPHSQGEAGLQALAAMGFEDPPRARDELLQLATGAGLRPFTRHVHQQFAAIAPFLLNALARTARPNATLMRLARILQRISAPASLYALLDERPVLSHFLVTLVDNSEYLGSILARDPGLLEVFSNVDVLDIATSRDVLEDQLEGLTGAYASEAALYRLRDGETLRIGMRDLVRNITVAQVGDELTQLAEVILEYVLKQARKKTAERFGATDIPFAVLGLGKLGGREMGYGSDLDLVFVYEAGGSIASGVSLIEYFSDLASRALRTLRERNRYGVLYDIDARLRPDGNKGVLAVDHERLDEYYTKDAQAWERFALMKARAVAGDPAFARRVEESAKDAAFSLEWDRRSLEHIESLRAQLAKQASPLDLKAQEGGIAEVEFIVRFWQLRHIRRYPQIRRGDVFGALDVLGEHDLVSSAQCAVLREAYGMLRKIQNRIRMRQGRQVSTLPEAREDQAELAARLGIKEDLLEYVNRIRTKVHAIYEQTYRQELTRL